MNPDTTRFRIRLTPGAVQPVDPTERLLDWAPGTRAATIEFAGDFFADWQPTPAGRDLLRFAASVYCADRTVLRRDSRDAWTRDLLVEMPVTDPGAWAEAPWPNALRFLTGDRWTVQAYGAGSAHTRPGAGLPVDAVSLFVSGGLDSLCGVIDLLEDNPGLRLLLVAHHEGGQASTAQRAVYGGLIDAYGAERVQLRRMFCRPAPPHPAQTQPLPDVREPTTRSRSLLFLTGALAAASASGRDVSVYVPENGWIGLNVPLTRARTGSASTHTTHPHFLDMLTDACRTIGVDNRITNPFRLRTKGEVLSGCSNPQLLARLVPASISCAHPETPRWRGRPQGNCGYCLPCLARRAALARIKQDHAADYSWDVLTDPDLLNPAERTGADLRATVHGVSPHRDELDIVRNAPLPAGEHRAHLELWRRGAEEIRTWLADATGPLAEFTAAAWRNP